MKLLTTKSILEVNDSELVHTRANDGSILILKTAKKKKEPDSYLIEGLSVHVFEAIDGKKNLDLIIKDLQEEFLLEADANAAFKDFVLQFSQDLVKEGIALLVGKK